MLDYRQKAEALIEEGDDKAAGLFAVAAALESVAHQIKYLGGGDHGSQQGAIELLAINLGTGFSRVASALEQMDPSD